jgi:hypothetical protein
VLRESPGSGQEVVSMKKIYFTTGVLAALLLSSLTTFRTTSIG